MIEDKAAQRGKTRWVVFFGGIRVYNCDNGRDSYLREMEIQSIFRMINEMVNSNVEITAENIRRYFSYVTNRDVAQILSINKNGRPLQFRDNIE